MTARRRKNSREAGAGEAGDATSTASTTGDGPKAGGEGTVVIKKYANRRLYDTSSSSYVNLDTIADLVREGADVRVVEARSGEDVTRQVLTQIIVEGSRDAEGPPLEFLKDLVRAGDRAQRDFLRWYLSSAAEVYQRVRSGWERAYRMTPAGMLQERLSKVWDPGAIVRGLIPHLDPPRVRTEEAEESAPAGEDTAAELARLRRQLDQLEQRIGGED